MKNQDILFGIGIIVFACIFFGQTTSLPAEPALFPRILLGVIVVLGVGIIVRSLWRQKKGKSEETNTERISFKEFALNALIPAGILLLMCFLMMYVGFYVGCFLLFSIIFILEDIIINGKISLKRKEIVKLFVSTLGVTVFFYICFTVLLRLPTPMGPWGF